MEEYTVKVYSNKTEWFQNGLCHRTDGPAFEWSDGYKEWYINGEKLSEKEFLKRQNSCDNKIVTIEGKNYRLILE